MKIRAIRIESFAIVNLRDFPQNYSLNDNHHAKHTRNLNYDFLQLQSCNVCNIDYIDCNKIDYNRL